MVFFLCTVPYYRSKNNERNTTIPYRTYVERGRYLFARKKPENVTFLQKQTKKKNTLQVRYRTVPYLYRIKFLK